MGSVKTAWIDAQFEAITEADWERYAQKEAELRPATRAERQDEAGWQVEREHAYKVAKAFRDAELEDLIEGRMDDDFNRWGGA